MMQRHPSGNEPSTASGRGDILEVDVKTAELFIIHRELHSSGQSSTRRRQFARVGRHHERLFEVSDAGNDMPGQFRAKNAEQFAGALPRDLTLGSSA